MDDLNLNKVNLDNTNSAHQSASAPQSNGNRPKLRKIKRPKQHNGPIVSGTAKNNSSAVQPQANAASLNNMPTQTGLVRAQNLPQNYGNYQNKSYSSAPSYVDDNYQNENYDSRHNAFSASTTDMKKLVAIACGCLLVGVLLGKMIFSGGNVVQNGLQGVVRNSDVPKGRPRCGVAEKTQGCVLYIMNPQRQELKGRDFYDWASQLTGRQRFVIETGNMSYSNMKIKPGEIAHLNIPPLQ